MLWKNKPHMHPPLTSSHSHKKEAFPSIITSDLHVLGNIVSDGTVDLSGSVDGNIRCQTLTVRKSGSVKGEITAENAFIYGKVNGLIRAKNVQLFADCHIEGIVMHESLTIEDGAFIDGKLKRTDKVAADEEDSSSAATAAPAKIMDNIRLIR